MFVNLRKTIFTKKRKDFTKYATIRLQAHYNVAPIILTKAAIE